MSEDLNQLRDAIDSLDDEILKALDKRMRLSDRVIAAKKGVAAFRPGREAMLVHQLVTKCQMNEHDLAPEVVLSVWRQIMAASLGRQNGVLNCAVHPGVMPAATWHMGCGLLAVIDDDMTKLIGAVASGHCQYAIVPADDNLNTLLASLDQFHQLKIIARTPLYDIQAMDPAFIIADYLADPSGDDVSVYAIQSAMGFDLLRVDGHHTVVSESCLPLEARLIGSYAR